MKRHILICLCLIKSLSAFPQVGTTAKSEYIESVITQSNSAIQVMAYYQKSAYKSDNQWGQIRITNISNQRIDLDFDVVVTTVCGKTKTSHFFAHANPGDNSDGVVWISATDCLGNKLTDSKNVISGSTFDEYNRIKSVGYQNLKFAVNKPATAIASQSVQQTTNSREISSAAVQPAQWRNHELRKVNKTQSDATSRVGLDDQQIQLSRDAVGGFGMIASSILSKNSNDDADRETDFERETKYLDKWYDLAAKGNPVAMRKLGQYYEYGKFKNVSTAAKWWEKAARAGDISALNHLCNQYHNDGDLTKEKEWDMIRQAAVKDRLAHCDTIRNLASFATVDDDIYAAINNHNMNSVENNPSSAQLQTTMAAKFKERQNQLAKLTGVETTSKRVNVQVSYEPDYLKWLEKGASLSDLSAQKKLGEYFQGAQVKNFEQSTKWLITAAQTIEYLEKVTPELYAVQSRASVSSRDKGSINAKDILSNFKYKAYPYYSAIHKQIFIDLAKCYDESIFPDRSNSTEAIRYYSKASNIINMLLATGAEGKSELNTQLEEITRQIEVLKSK